MPAKRMKAPTRARETVPEKKAGFYIVGIGASAGGLEAFERFFQNMPDNPGMAFILVPHLDPTHASLMPSLIQKSSKMSVVQVKDNARVEPNCIYIIPPNRDLAILKGVLQLMDAPKAPGPRMPIDYFFRSLAQDQGPMAICVIMSGMGTDGTMGLRAVKAELGMTMVQAPESAKYDSMPKSALATELVDFVLSPELMPAQLVSYVTHSRTAQPSKLAITEGKTPDALKKIFIMLRSATGHDFSSYKKNTIYRRVERRMNIHQIDRINAYVRFLQENPHELSNLFKELLIGVTNFFRDPEAFDILKDKAFPVLLDDKAGDYAVRVWVPGCSTGEEAYSVAIILREYMDARRQHFSVQIFATDIDSSAIDNARTGIYPASIATDVSNERLKRFFTAEDKAFRIKKEIRDMLVFAPQDIIKDPPFTKLDLICCRNLLIYMDGDLQKKLIPIFHYSIRPGGALFLGSSETVGGYTNLFHTIDKKWKIYRRADAAVSAQIAMEFPPVQPLVQGREGERKPPEFGVVQAAERAFLVNFAPPRGHRHGRRRHRLHPRQDRQVPGAGAGRGEDERSRNGQGRAEARGRRGPP